MKAVILAGGLGMRLRPVTGEHPKPMAPVLGRPVMEHIVELIHQWNCVKDMTKLLQSPRQIAHFSLCAIVLQLVTE